MSRFGTTLKRILDHRDITAREASRKSGVDPSMMSRWINSQRPITITPKTLARVAAAISPDHLERAEIIAAYLQDILNDTGNSHVQIQVSGKPFTLAHSKKSDDLLTFFRKKSIANPQIEKMLTELAKAFGYNVFPASCRKI